MKSRLYQKYIESVRPALIEKRKYQNIHQVPHMEKIVVNMGVSASLEKGAVDDAVKDLTMITGRKPVINKARKSIANFKLREGQSIGCRVTLRRDVMYEFSIDWLRRRCRESGISGAHHRARSTVGQLFPRYC